MKHISKYPKLLLISIPNLFFIWLFVNILSKMLHCMVGWGWTMLNCVRTHRALVHRGRNGLWPPAAWRWYGGLRGARLSKARVGEMAMKKTFNTHKSPKFGQNFHVVLSCASGSLWTWSLPSTIDPHLEHEKRGGELVAFNGLMGFTWCFLMGFNGSHQICRKVLCSQVQTCQLQKFPETHSNDTHSSSLFSPSSSLSCPSCPWLNPKFVIVNEHRYGKTNFTDDFAWFPHRFSTSMSQFTLG